MSMYVTVVRVTPAAFDAIQRDPSQLDGVLFDENEALMKRLGITERDSAGFDYRSATEMMDSMEELEEAEAVPKEEEEEDGEEDAEHADAEEAAEAAAEAAEEEAEREDADDEDGEGAVSKDLGADGTLDYDAGFGPAFTLSPAAVQQVAKEGSALALDEDVKALFEAAAQRGDYIIGVVS